jgi:hypothetical protein
VQPVPSNAAATIACPLGNNAQERLAAGLVDWDLQPGTAGSVTGTNHNGPGYS